MRVTKSLVAPWNSSSLFTISLELANRERGMKWILIDYKDWQRIFQRSFNATLTKFLLDELRNFVFFQMNETRNHADAKNDSNKYFGINLIGGKINYKIILRDTLFDHSYFPLVFFQILRKRTLNERNEKL